MFCALGGAHLARHTQGRRRADAHAARVPPPRAARTDRSTADFSHAPAAAGRPGARVLDPGRDRAVGHRAHAPRRDDWHGRADRRAERTFRAFVYQLMTAGLRRRRWRRRRSPARRCYAEVGDVIVVHFRNGRPRSSARRSRCTRTASSTTPTTTAPTCGDFTRVGGFIAPGEEFTYTWEATPESVGVWPYHDHGPNHTLNTSRGLFGAIIIREPGREDPRRRDVLFLALAPAADHRPRADTSSASTAAPPPATRRRCAPRSARTSPSTCSADGPDVPHFHVHGHRWKDPPAPSWTTPTLGPNETDHRPLRPRTTRAAGSTTATSFTHQDGGMAGWYLVDLNRRRNTFA